MTKKNIFFVTNHLTFIVSHRLNILKSVKKYFNVHIITGIFSIKSLEKKAYKILKKNKINVHFAAYKSTNLSFFSDLIGFFQICKLLIIYKPELIHLITNKAIVLGFLASITCNIKKVIVTISGFGFISSSEQVSKKILNFFYFKFIFLFVYLKKNCLFIVQNLSDKKVLVYKSLVNSKKIILIPGSGVNLSKLQPTAFNKRKKIVILPARVLKAKGIIEYVNSVKFLKLRFPEWKFLVIGTYEYNSPDALNSKILSNFLNLKYVQFIGHKENILKYYKKCSIICLPSYNEGFPKCLIEAVVLQIPIVATNIAGNRSIVKNKINGFLVPPRNIKLLTKYLRILISNPKLRFQMSKKSKLINSTYFNEMVIVKKHLEIYINNNKI